MTDYNPTAGLSRRDLLKLTATGAGGLAMSGWMPVLAAHAAQVQDQTGKPVSHKKCILLWMNGGPSHKDTFDLKPISAQPSPFKAIDTNVPGIRISENFPKLARLMNHATIIRSMSTLEGAHPRARFHMHTGYREGIGGLVYPSLGSIVSKEIGDPSRPLPNFVSVSQPGYSSGYLGPQYQPLNVQNPAQGVANLQPLVGADRFNNRMSMLEEMEQSFLGTYHADASTAHRVTYQRAVQMLKSREAQAFNVASEPQSVRSAYGTNAFGQGCLLARRLVETGVSFVEVGLNGWDTHNNNNERVQQLSAQVDPAMSQLVIDLQQRGLLNDTLIIWMGEFGRTPQMNTRAGVPGRDHYPRAWSLVMMGGGLPNGRVVGRTDAQGATVVERPVSCVQFMATVCKALGVDYTKMNQTPIGRPIRIVERGGEPVNEVFKA
jgi:uncharacterized protein (DUF1501 family)